MAESQKVLFIQEQRNIDRIKMPVCGNGQYLIDEKATLKWQRIRELCYPIKGVGSGLHMIIDSRWSLPVSPYEWILDSEVIDKLTDEDEIFYTSFNDTKTMSERERRRDNLNDMLVLAVVLAVGGLIFFFLMTGKIF